MALGRPIKPLNVTAEEKEKLTMLARRPKSSQAVAMRARIVLGCDGGMNNTAVSELTACYRSHSLQVARALPSGKAGRSAGRTATWGTARDR